MFIRPSIHLEIARERQQDLRPESERHRTARAALAVRHEDRARPLIERAALHEPSPTATACRLHRVNS